MLGFFGKGSIHPKKIPILNEVIFIVIKLSIHFGNVKQLIKLR